MHSTATVEPDVVRLHHTYDLQKKAAAAATVPAPLAQRREWLKRLEQMLLTHREALAQAISDDFGQRAKEETELLELVPCLNAIRHAYRHLPRWMKDKRCPVALEFQPGKAWVQYQPLGVVGIIAPWNYSLLLCVGPLVDALAAGNRVLLKPSELTPRFASLLASLCGEVFEVERVSVITGGVEVAQALSSLPLDHLFFTGSTAVGKKVALAAAENLTPVTLELGGKSPAVIERGYPLDDAARSIVLGKFFNAGQTCIAPDYVLAPQEQVDEIAQALLTALRHSYPAGAGDINYTSLIAPHAKERIARMLADARARGASVLTLGEQSQAGAENSCSPAIIVNPPDDAEVMQHEIFGPLLPVIGYQDLAHAAAYINARPRPLALYGFGKAHGWCRALLASTLSGGVTLNGTLLHIAQAELPFGGVGQSGQGGYHGRAGFERFSHARSVYKAGAIRPFEWLRPPYGRFARTVIEVLIKHRAL